MAEQTAVVDVADVLRRQFSDRLERYRAIIAEAVDADGKLPAETAVELATLMEQLGLPADRFGEDCAALIRVRNLERRKDAILAENGKAIADVPTLEAELEELSREFVQVMSQFRQRQADLEREMAKRRQAIASEVHRPRQSTANLDAELRRAREGNPVMFRRDVTAEELPQLLGVRQAVVGDVA